MSKMANGLSRLGMDHPGEDRAVAGMRLALEAEKTHSAGSREAHCVSQAFARRIALHMGLKYARHLRRFSAPGRVTPRLGCA